MTLSRLIVDLEREVIEGDPRSHTCPFAVNLYEVPALRASGKRFCVSSALSESRPTCMCTHTLIFVNTHIFGLSKQQARTSSSRVSTRGKERVEEGEEKREMMRQRDRDRGGAWGERDPSRSTPTMVSRSSLFDPVSVSCHQATAAATARQSLKALSQSSQNRASLRHLRLSPLSVQFHSSFPHSGHTGAGGAGRTGAGRRV